MSWQQLLGEEKRQPYFVDTLTQVEQARQAGQVIYPPQSDVFNAFKLTELDNLKVVLLGQDPYHGPNQAHGLAFSVRHGVRVPPSLQNMYKELALEYPEFVIPAHGCLEDWAKQGVLLLNTVLTVVATQANSHRHLGWEQFTDKVIAQISEHCHGIVFLLWGSHAQKKGRFIDRQRHYVLEAPHPSPLSAHRGFLGCGHFKQANELLVKQGKTPINWQL
ncbi:MAG: uracil-DNA glycosylase [Rheinheimera aquimaris]|jgi:uracil-DNA glycosylase|uniref:uracil-DNA glycosylase n=1 Tax=Rheinheimera aquimaris TaxID=412437 RepID=UPI000E8B145A|nr:uracil-DNA glycosylase [Rheinheimera sp.]|tara:strand:- start:1090 stop:1746 length:657 start_codon:yes stop_codon:yes gene_type:complete